MDTAVGVIQCPGAAHAAELFGYDADRAKIEKTLGELAGLEIADVVSTSGAHHEALEVSATSFDRRVTLTGSGGSVEILFGSSGRANSVHVRKAAAICAAAALRRILGWAPLHSSARAQVTCGAPPVPPGMGQSTTGRILR